MNIQGIENHQIIGIPIVTAGAVFHTQRGPVIVILRQYVYIGHGKVIHSSEQLESFNCDINDKSMKVNGWLQHITTQEIFAIPLDIISGLPYVNLRPYTDKEWNILTHIIIISNITWDLTILDNIISEDERWFDAVSDHVEDISPLFDIYGDYSQRHEVHNVYLNRYNLGDGNNPINEIPHIINNFKSTCSELTQPSNIRTDNPPDYTSHIPHFAWQSMDIIKCTFDATTKYVRGPMSIFPKQHYRSLFSALNFHRGKELVATDIIYFNTPAVSYGTT